MNDLVPDSERTGLIGGLPKPLRPYASLMRVDRPIGTWLLYWPCAWSVALAGVRGEWALFLWFLLGAFAMVDGAWRATVAQRERPRHFVLQALAQAQCGGFLQVIGDLHAPVALQARANCCRIERVVDHQ